MIELVNRSEIKFLGVCMLLLSAAAGWLLLTRPTHRIEGDFLQREDRRTVDDWLVEQLVSPIAEYRVRACRALGRIGDESTLGLLLKVLEDPIPRVRAEAAFAIGEMDDRDTRAELGRAPRAAAVAGLMSALADDERIVVTNVVEALGKLRRAEAYPRLTQTAAPLPVTMAALVRLEKREAVPWIAARRRSDDQETRWAATQALLDLQADVGEELTRSFINLMRDRNPWIRLEAARGLGRVEPSKEVRQALVAAIDDPDPKVVMQGLRSISDVKPPDALPLLVESLGHRNENVRAARSRPSATSGDPKAVPLIESLRGRASPVSYQAEIALAKLGAPSVFFRAGGELPEKYRHAAAIESLLSERASKPAGAVGVGGEGLGRRMKTLPTRCARRSCERSRQRSIPTPNDICGRRSVMPIPVCGGSRSSCCRRLRLRLAAPATRTQRTTRPRGSRLWIVRRVAPVDRAAPRPRRGHVREGFGRSHPPRSYPRSETTAPAFQRGPRREDRGPRTFATTRRNTSTSPARPAA